MKEAGYMSWALQMLNQRLSLVVFILQPQVKNPSECQSPFGRGMVQLKCRKVWALFG